MPFRVHNTTTNAVYTVGLVSEDETDITSDTTPALTAGGVYVNAAYGEDATVELAASSKAKSKEKKSGGTV